MPITRVEIICAVCDQKFWRGKAEFERSERLNRPHYCGLACAGKANCANISPTSKRWQHLNAGNRLDNFSQFRSLHRIARRRAKDYQKEFSITLRDLADRWELQNGICIYTGWPMILPATSLEYNRTAKNQDPRRASIDRIDSGLGYLVGNIQFVCHMANVAKNSYTHEQMLEFCRAIAAFHK